MIMCREIANLVHEQQIKSLFRHQIKPKYFYWVLWIQLHMTSAGLPRLVDPLCMITTLQWRETSSTFIVNG